MSGTSNTTGQGCVVPASLAPTQQNDQTGMRIYTLDGTRLAAAWGQDVEHADSNQPQQLDMGTTVVPFSSLNAFKSGTLLVDLNNNGGLDVNDTLLYTTVIRNTGIIPVTLVRVTDDLDDGTAYVPGTFEIDASVSDAAGRSDQRQYALIVLDAPHFVSDSLPPATVGVSYAARIEATGGRAPLAYAFGGGTTPPGLGIDASGTLSGIPSTAGSYSFEISVTDAPGLGIREIRGLEPLAV